MEVNICSICLTGNTDYTTNCNHTFHKKCIDKWKHHNTCPYCRKELIQLEKYWKIKHKIYNNMCGIGELIKKNVQNNSICYSFKNINSENNIIKFTRFFHNTVWDIEPIQ